MTAPMRVEVDGVEKHYATPAGPIRANDGITFTVAPGASVAITGPSGCGKSTLLALLGGLETPTRGRVALGEHEISTMNEHARAEVRRREIGFVFQADNLLPFLTAVENVAMQLSLYGAKEGFDRCVDLLARVCLADRLESLPDQLSRGQRQRVAVARALVHRPGLLLADEPTGSLDVDTGEAIVELLSETQRETGATLIVVTHDASIAQRLDGRVELRDGRVVADATPQPLGEA